MPEHTHNGDAVSKLYEYLHDRREKLQQQLEAVEKEFQAVSTTLKLMGLPTPGMSRLDLSGLSHIQALVAIATENNGILIVKTARRLMEKAGLFKTAKNASSILFTAITRSGLFERLEAGKYQLLDKPKEAPAFKLADAINA